MNGVRDMATDGKNEKWREYVVAVLALANLVLPTIVLLPPWHGLENDPWVQLVAVIGWVIFGHFAASFLFYWLARKLRPKVVASWIVLVNALIGLGGPMAFEAWIVWNNMPGMSGVYFAITPFIQIAAALPSLITLLIVWQKSRVAHE